MHITVNAVCHLLAYSIFTLHMDALSSPKVCQIKIPDISSIAGLFNRSLLSQMGAGVGVCMCVFVCVCVF